MGPYDHIDTIFYTVDATLAYEAEKAFTKEKT